MLSLLKKNFSNPYDKRYLLPGGVAFIFATVSAIALACGSPYTPRTPIVLSYDEFRTNITIEQPQTIANNGKIVLYQNYLIINEPKTGFHVYDNEDPSNPTPLSFIPVAGNLDIAIKDNYLYADSYVDLLVFDMNEPSNIQFTQRIEDAFSPLYINAHYGVPEENGIIIGLR